MHPTNSLIQAFRETHYYVYTETPFYLVPDKFSVELAELHDRTSVTSSAFITACNPMSKIVDSKVNAEQNMRLSKEVLKLGYSAVSGLGKHPSNEWPGEESLLVLGIQYEEACNTGILFGQIAILFSSTDAIPMLVMLENTLNK